MSRQRLILGLLIAIVPSSFMSFAREDSNDSQKVRSGRNGYTLRLPGIARPVDSAVLSTTRAGSLMMLVVDEGEQVEVNQILATVDNQVALAEFRLAQAVAARVASVVIAEFEIKRTHFILERMKQVGSTSVSALELEEARTAYQQAVAGLKQAAEQRDEAQLSLELAKRKLESYDLKAPFSGTVLKIHRAIGEHVDKDDDLIEIADLTKLRAELQIPLDWFDRLQRGDSYQLRAGHPVNKTLEAKLIHYDRVVNSATRSFRCVFQIDNQALRLPAGFAVRFVHPSGKHATNHSHRTNR